MSLDSWRPPDRRQIILLTLVGAITVGVIYVLWGNRPSNNSPLFGILAIVCVTLLLYLVLTLRRGAPFGLWILLFPGTWNTANFSSKALFNGELAVEVWLLVSLLTGFVLLMRLGGHKSPRLPANPDSTGERMQQT